MSKKTWKQMAAFALVLAAGLVILAVTGWLVTP